MRVLVTTTRSWHLERTALAFSARQALAGLWMADRNRLGLPAAEYRRCWPYHLAMKPFYHLASQLWQERATYWLIGFWQAWLRASLRSSRCPQFEVVQAIMGFASEIFDRADAVGALKVLDCPNSHPTTYYGFWQRECDRWCPGERVPIPRFMFARMNREIERADVILSPSNFVRDTMVWNGIDPARCFINPFGVDTATFTRRKEPPPAPRFICVGTICLRKGHHYLFPAFEIVKRQLPQAELVCVGHDKIDFRKQRPKWAGLYQQHRSLRHAQLNELMQNCTAFVLPSCEEGFARVLSEAMAAGLPIIASYESGATTVVTEGTEGFIVSRNPAEIAAAMLKLATDRDLNRRMGEAAYRKGSLQNTWQDYGDRLLAEYGRRLASRPAGAVGSNDSAQPQAKRPGNPPGRGCSLR
ncbi:MAG: glycosyltransferase family 4 protein [Verrucomicrobiota bacterium]|jgi:glycosyltransferase involved in cell wall biosynthesis